MMHSLLALILSAFATPQECPRQVDCPMPRVHYTADTVYVIADHTGPVFIHARMSEPVAAPECSVCALSRPAETTGAPTDAEAVCLTDVVVHPAAKKPAQRYFTGPTH